MKQRAFVSQQSTDITEVVLEPPQCFDSSAAQEEDFLSFNDIINTVQDDMITQLEDPDDESALQEWIIQLDIEE